MKYRVIEDVKGADDSIKYLAEDTELHRSVAIRVLPQSSAEQIERAQNRRRTLSYGVGALGVLLALAFAFFPLFSPAPVADRAVVKFSFSPENAAGDAATISPDGQHIFYQTATEGESVLWLRSLAIERPRKLEGTEGAHGGAWSPDSKQIAFGTDGELGRIPIDGGAPITLCPLPAPRQFRFLGASWSPDGERIVFSSGGNLYEVAARGGEPTLLFEPNQVQAGGGFFHPHFLPSSSASEALLYVTATGPSDSKVWLLDVKTREHRELTRGDGPVYAKSGHLIFHPGNEWDTGLRALPFSAEKLEVTGEAFPIDESGRYASVSSAGTLVYTQSKRSRSVVQLVWKDRDGATLSAIGQPQEEILVPNLSPDGRLVAVQGREGGQQDIWLHEVNRPIKTRVTFDESLDHSPTWLPTGDVIAFSSDRPGGRELYLRRIDGNSPPEPLLETDPSVLRWLSDWSGDGRLALFYERPASVLRSHDLWYLQRRDDDSGYEAVPFLQTPFSEHTPQFSPDENWVAYVSDESGSNEVYIRSFPDGGENQRVSVNGGNRPRWSREGGEVFYVEGSTLMAVPVSTRPNLTIGQPQRLFVSEGLADGPGILNYDVAPDGEKFVLRERVLAEDTAAEEESGDRQRPTIRVVRNWYEEFRGREQD